MPPSMSSSEVLVIWILRIAMKAPIMPARMAIQVVRLALSSAWAEIGLVCEEPAVAAWIWFGMVVFPGSTDLASAGVGQPRACGLALSSGLDRGIDRHAGAQIAGKWTIGIKRDLDRNALDDLGEIAGGIVGRQQSEFLPAGRRDAVYMASDCDAREHINIDHHRLAGTHIGKLRL